VTVKAVDGDNNDGTEIAYSMVESKHFANNNFSDLLYCTYCSSKRGGGGVLAPSVLFASFF
jgi:hypothetical protein